MLYNIVFFKQITLIFYPLNMLFYLINNTKLQINKNDREKQINESAYNRFRL